MIVFVEEIKNYFLNLGIPRYFYFSENMGGGDYLNIDIDIDIDIHG